MRRANGWSSLCNKVEQNSVTVRDSRIFGVAQLGAIRAIAREAANSSQITFIGAMVASSAAPGRRIIGG